MATDKRSMKAYFAWLLLLEAMMVGVFAATDVFLFYVFFEAMLVPMYFIIGSFGGPRRQYAAVKFFLYSLVGGLIMLAAVIGLYVVSTSQLGEGTFAFDALRQLDIDPGVQKLLFLGFFIAFAIKAPLVPFHTWLPDSGSEAPIGGAVLLVGVLDKVGTFGFLRYCLPLFPDASRYFAPFVLVLSVVGILYAALLAMGQSDMKRLVSYTSISHFGFIALGIFAFTKEAATGAVLYMVNHGIATGLLFLVVGMVIARGGSRQIGDYGGLAAAAPLLGGAFLMAGLASLALPGTNSFVSEFLVLIGSFQTRPVFTILATVGIILAALYVLLMYQRTMHGPPRGVLLQQDPADARPARGRGATARRRPPRRRRPLRVRDLDRRELAVVTPLIALIIALGVYPQPAAEPDRTGRRGHPERPRRVRLMIEAPDLSLAALAPLLFVFGAACIGVLVEAFAPRDIRHPVQVAVALVGTLGALVTTLLLSGSHEVTAAGALAVDGAALFLQATIAGLGVAGDPAVRRARPGPGPVGVRDVGGGARRQPARPRPADLRAGADRGLPAGDLRDRRHDAVRRGERPAGHVRRARGAQPAALPDLRAGPAPAPAVAGGRGQVLPAGRLRLGVLPVRPRAGLRRHRQRPALGDPRGLGRRQAATSCSSSAWRCSSSACCSRAASRRSTPGRRTSTRALRRRSRRSWPPARRSPRSARSCACSTSPSARRSGPGGR